MTAEETLRARRVGINGEFDYEIKSHLLTPNYAGWANVFTESHKRLSDILHIDMSLLHQLVTVAMGLVPFKPWIHASNEPEIPRFLDVDLSTLSSLTIRLELEKGWVDGQKELADTDGIPKGF